MKKYQARRAAEGVDPLGYYMAPWGYAQLQVLQQAVEATKSVDDKKLADYIRANTFKTVVGDVKFGANGEWAQSRVLQVQFHDIKGNGVDQFREMGTQTIISPDALQIGQRRSTPTRRRRNSRSRHVNSSAARTSSARRFLGAPSLRGSDSDEAPPRQAWIASLRSQ